jgi:hypothetical protein
MHKIMYFLSAALSAARLIINEPGCPFIFECAVLEQGRGDVGSPRAEKDRCVSQYKNTIARGKREESKQLATAYRHTTRVV